MDTWGMSDCQSDAALPWAAAPVSVSLWIATNRSCQVDCHEESQIQPQAPKLVDLEVNSEPRPSQKQTLDQ